MITNTKEVKMQIRKLGLSQKEFATKAGLVYDYLNSTVNGTHLYTSVIEAFDKYGIHYELNKPLKKKAKKEKSVA